MPHIIPPLLHPQYRCESESQVGYFQSIQRVSAVVVEDWLSAERRADPSSDPFHNHLGPADSFTAVEFPSQAALLLLMNFLSYGLRNVNTQSRCN